MSPSIYATIGQRLKAERLREGLTLEQLAEAAGISPSFLAYIENGKKKLSVQTLWKLAQALHLSPGALFENAATKASRTPVVSHQIDFLMRDRSPTQRKHLLRALRTLLNTRR